MCLKLQLRDDIERFTWCLDHWLCCMFDCIHVCVSLLKKLFLKASLTPPRHLAIYQASKLFFLSQSQHLLDTWWINRESSCLIDSFSTTRSIDRASVLDMLGCSSTLALHLHLSMAIFLSPALTACSIPLNTYICQDLLMAYIITCLDVEPRQQPCYFYHFFSYKLKKFLHLLKY